VPKRSLKRTKWSKRGVSVIDSPTIVLYLPSLVGVVTNCKSLSAEVAPTYR